jgi:hypothetical protein
MILGCAVCAIGACATAPPRPLAGSLSCRPGPAAGGARRVEFLLDTAATVLRTRLEVRVRPARDSSEHAMILTDAIAPLVLTGPLAGQSCRVAQAGLRNMRTIELRTGGSFQVVVLAESDRRTIASVTLDPGSPKQELRWGTVTLGFSGGARGL